MYGVVNHFPIGYVYFFALELNIHPCNVRAIRVPQRLELHVKERDLFTAGLNGWQLAVEHFALAV